MHYVLVISSLTSGGAERVLVRLANYWVQSGHKVSIITFSNTPSFYPLDDRVVCHYLPTTSYRWLRFIFFCIRIVLFRIKIWQLKPDVVLSFLDKVNILTLFMLYKQGIPVVVSERIDPAYHYIHPVWRWLRKKLYPAAKKVIVQTSSVASYFPIPTTIIPNPVIPIETACDIRENANHIVTVGRLDPQKDHKTLVYAIQPLIKENPNIRLTIYGEGKERGRLEALIQKLELQNHISLPGSVPHIIDELRKADVFVFPSLYEGFPNALCEAMALGMPVVASRCSGNVDLIQDGINGRIFEIGDVTGLTEALREIINSYDKRKMWGKEARQTVKDYKPENILKLWDDVMTDAASKPRPY